MAANSADSDEMLRIVAFHQFSLFVKHLGVISNLAYKGLKYALETS